MDWKIHDKSKKYLVINCKYKMEHWEEYQSISTLIEDIFTLKKEGVSLKRVHRYTWRSVHKIVSLTALLAIKNPRFLYLQN